MRSKALFISSLVAIPVAVQLGAAMSTSRRDFDPPIAKAIAVVVTIAGICAIIASVNEKQSVGLRVLRIFGVIALVLVVVLLSLYSLLAVYGGIA